jgi:hypothetical protein
MKDEVLTRQTMVRIQGEAPKASCRASDPMVECTPLPVTDSKEDSGGDSATDLGCGR